jgi:predicted O-linked N-acetylglucosamine transferase (SPINDLY family)
VAASLLESAGLPELVTGDAAAYEALALVLAQDPPALARLHARLAAHRLSAPLFDTQRFTSDLERGYAAAVARQRRGLAPVDLQVARSHG